MVKYFFQIIRLNTLHLVDVIGTQVTIRTKEIDIDVAGKASYKLSNHTSLT